MTDERLEEIKAFSVKGGPWPGSALAALQETIAALEASEKRAVAADAERDELIGIIHRVNPPGQVQWAPPMKEDAGVLLEGYIAKVEAEIWAFKEENAKLRAESNLLFGALVLARKKIDHSVGSSPLEVCRGWCLACKIDALIAPPTGGPR